MTDALRGRLPWAIVEHEECFVILDADGRSLYQIPFRRDLNKPDPLDRMSWDEALKVARPLLRLPELLKLEKRAKG